MTAAEAGHNSKLTEAERNALFGYLVRGERDALAERRAADDKRKENFKKGKEWGFAKTEIEFFVKAREEGEGSSLVEKHRMQQGILIKLGFIPDDRGGDLLADRADRIQLIYAKGKANGLAGEDCASGYAGGSDEDRAFVDGWKAGQMEFADNWKTAMEKAIAARTKEEPAPAGDADPFAEDSTE